MNVTETHSQRESLPPHGFFVRALEPLLVLPSEAPEVPSGGLNPRVFRASVRYLRYRYTKLLVVLLLEIHGAIALVTGAFATNMIFGFVTASFVSVATMLFIVFFYAAIRLDYDLHQYVVTDRALRIRAGAVIVEEITITYANIQDIEVQQGPIQRIFGISDLVVRTAGGGSGKKGESPMGGHRGALAGIANPKEVRDIILSALAAFRDSGLGDPDDHRSARTRSAGTVTAGDGGDLRQAALELRAASRELHEAIQL